MPENHSEPLIVEIKFRLVAPGRIAVTAVSQPSNSAINRYYDAIAAEFYPRQDQRIVVHKGVFRGLVFSVRPRTEVKLQVKHGFDSLEPVIRSLNAQIESPLDNPEHGDSSATHTVTRYFYVSQERNGNYLSVIFDLYTPIGRQ
jgi:hypothetical protein